MVRQGKMGANQETVNPVSLVFGPVPSRRLGRSLGINNVSPKTCSYSCVYCQLGPTSKMRIKRRPFHTPEEVVKAVRSRLLDAQRRGEEVDYLTFVPGGEPTLDAGLGQEIKGLKDLGLPIAVITNASLLYREDVREELSWADWVSLKADAGREATWKRINRPHKALFLEEIQAGILEFAHIFSGTLTTETMLVFGMNDSLKELCLIASFLEEVKPDVAYLSIPTRPPTESWVNPPAEEVLVQAYAIFAEHLPRVELLIGYEGNAFAASGDGVEDLLSITAVHPMREEGVRELLAEDGASWKVVEDLMKAGVLVRLEYGGHKFYLRALPGRGRQKEGSDAMG